MGSEMHEPDAVKVARPVLGRGRDGNISPLFNNRLSGCSDEQGYITSVRLISR